MQHTSHLQYTSLQCFLNPYDTLGQRIWKQCQRSAANALYSMHSCRWGFSACTVKRSSYIKMNFPECKPVNIMPHMLSLNNTIPLGLQQQISIMHICHLFFSHKEINKHANGQMHKTIFNVIENYFTNTTQGYDVDNPTYYTYVLFTYV